MTQAEAELLIAIPKTLEKPQCLCVPLPGCAITVDAHSTDRRHAFVFDIYRGRVALRKCFYNKRIRGGDTLVRICLTNKGHKNPDGTMIREPHIHLFREGHDDKWAVPLPPEIADGGDDLLEILKRFMVYCNVVNCPQMQGGLF